MAKNGEVALRLQPGGGLCVPCYPAIDKSGRRRDRDRGKMNRLSLREWMPILPWPVWPLAGQC